MFGSEFEVSAKKSSVLHKAQSLENEQVGKKVVDLVMKPVQDCNIW
jgi:hypothetical protein